MKMHGAIYDTATNTINTVRGYVPGMFFYSGRDEKNNNKKRQKTLCIAQPCPTSSQERHEQPICCATGGSEALRVTRGFADPKKNTQKTKTERTKKRKKIETQPSENRSRLSLSRLPATLQHLEELRRPTTN